MATSLLLSPISPPNVDNNRDSSSSTALFSKSSFVPKTSHLFCAPSRTDATVRGRRFRSPVTASAADKYLDYIPKQFREENLKDGWSWSEFARNVSGEWDGFGADFTFDGKPIELSENVVPDAYREWEVKVFDWQTQCPTLANPDRPSAMYKLIKLLPTVGCEADAATQFSVDERTIGGADNLVSAFAYQSSGCYVAVWSTQKARVLELEHCLIDPRDKESRVRIIQIMDVEENHKLVLKNIKVFVEQWYGPFRNGEQLGGCAIRDSAFASTQALSRSQVLGVWQRSKSIASFQDSPHNIFQELVRVDGVEKVVRDGEHQVLLPKNLWSSMEKTEDGERTCCEVGWLLELGHAITSKCIFSRTAELKEIITSSEIATPARVV